MDCHVFIDLTFPDLLGTTCHLALVPCMDQEDVASQSFFQNGPEQPCIKAALSWSLLGLLGRPLHQCYCLHNIMLLSDPMTWIFGDCLNLLQ